MQASEFLYQRRGPWPQPSPAHPFGESPAVIHLPKEEQSAWNRYIGARYAWTLLTYWIPAGLFASKNKGLDEIPDAEFNHLLSFTPFSKFIRPIEDYDLQEGQPFVSLIKSQPKATFYIADFNFMESVKNYQGMYCAPTKCLLRQQKENIYGLKEIVAIHLKQSNLLLDPADGNAWELAKYFVLQGAGYRLVLSEHALLHFPYDCINAITKTALPKNNLVFKLIYPHLYLTLALNNTVLTSSHSPLQNNQLFPYSGFIGNFDDFQGFLKDSYHGMNDEHGNFDPSYKPFVFTDQPPQIYGEYDIFLRRYYDTFLQFTLKATKHLPDSQKKHVRQWADYIHQWLPQFPDGNQIFEENKLAATLAKIMWDLSIAHAADHYSYSQISIPKVPLRMRVPAPVTKTIPAFDRKKLIRWEDTFRQCFEREMFFRAANVTLLKNVDYNFNSIKLRTLNNWFIQQLRVTAAELKSEGVTTYIPLHEISCSIQY